MHRKQHKQVHVNDKWRRDQSCETTKKQIHTDTTLNAQ